MIIRDLLRELGKPVRTVVRAQSLRRMHVKGGELIVIDAKRLHQRSKSLKWLENMRQSGAAAAVIIGREETASTNELAAWGETRNFPVLLAKSQDVDFLEQQIADSPPDPDRSFLSRLAQIILADGNFEQVLKEIAIGTRLPLSLLSENLKLLAPSELDSDLEYVRSLEATLCRTPVRAKGDDLTALEAEDGRYRSLVVPVRTSRQVCGYLVAGPLSQSVSEIQLSLLQEAATALALQFRILRGENGAECRLKTEFVQDLLVGRLQFTNHTLEKARGIGLDTVSSAWTLVLEADVPAYGSGTSSVNRERDHYALAEILYRVLRRTCYSLKVRSVCVQIGTVIVILIYSFMEQRGSARGKIGPAAERFAEELMRHVKQTLGPITVSMGIGRATDSIREIPNSYKDALQALNLGRTKAGPGGIHVYQKFGLERLLFKLLDDPEALSFYEDFLGELEQQEADLVSTLDAYLDEKGHLANCARRLYLHPNSVKYRLRKLESIMGVSLEDAGTQLNLRAALMIRRMLSKRIALKTPHGLAENH